MRTLDKYIVKSFVVNYLISLTVMMCMYLVLDLFFNFDEFTQDGEVPLAQALAAAGRYYGAHVFLYFSQISGVITLFAMSFTLARMQNNSEFVAIVGCGVSLYRVAFTVIVMGIVLNGLWLIDQELIIPRLAPALAQKHAAMVSRGGYGVWFMREADGSLLSASRFEHQRGALGGLIAMKPTPDQGAYELVLADRATWSGDEHGGLWRLERGQRLVRTLDRDGTVRIEQFPVESLNSQLNPDAIALRQAGNWIQFLGRDQLLQIEQQGIASAKQVARAIHTRFATPIANMLILVIGVPFFLHRQPASVVQSAGKCLLMCGVCFLFAFFCHHVVWAASPALMAWLPLLLLTPVMVVQLDGMKT